MHQELVTDHLSTKHAQSKFKDAVLDSLGVTFQRNLAVRRHKMYSRALRSIDNERLEVVSGGYRASTQSGGDSAIQLEESSMDKLRRLIYETQELEQSLAAAGNVSDTNTEALNLPQHVQDLARQLEDLQVNSQDQLASVTAAVPTDLSRIKLPASVEIKLRSAANFKVLSHGTDDVSNAELSQLLKRIDQLERALGTQNVDTDAAPANIHDTLDKLEHDVNIISQPGALDGMASKCHQLIADLDRLEILQEDQPANIDAERVNELYAQCEHSATHLKNLPRVLTQLACAKPLLVSAHNFNESLSALQQQQDDTKMLAIHCQDLMKQLEQSFAATHSIVEQHIAKLSVSSHGAKR